MLVPIQCSFLKLDDAIKHPATFFCIGINIFAFFYSLISSLSVLVK